MKGRMHIHGCIYQHSGRSGAFMVLDGVNWDVENGGRVLSGIGFIARDW